MIIKANLRRLCMRILPLAILAAVAAGCTETSGPAPTSDVDPTGGTWKTIAISSPTDVLPATAPTAITSAEYKQELHDLKLIQDARTQQMTDTANFWNAGAVYRWQEIARFHVVKCKMPPTLASRSYALVSVAQYDALVAVWKAKYQSRRMAPSKNDATITPAVPFGGTDLEKLPSYPSEHAAVAAATAEILKYLYVDETASLNDQVRQHEESRLWAGVNVRSDITAGDSIGRAVAKRVLALAKTDGSDATWSDTIPKGPQYWRSTTVPPTPPLAPLWGRVRPWLVTSVPAMRPTAPPAFGSAEFNAALQEVRQISDTRTAEQTRIAKYWAYGVGTITPPGHWDSVAAQLAKNYKLSELRSARALALTNMAMMDGGICCWDAKYLYWLIRPSQADTNIKLAVGLPNFPSYTSGHSTFSGAACEVLIYLFPSDADWIRAAADEASISRLYGGIHYKFDCQTAMTGGRAIGQLAVQKGKFDGSP